MLAEFGSVVDAMRCAVDIQRRMAERNADTPHEKRIEFRIGINVGDVIIDRGDIFGDGVNVAARLEGIAEPGGICVSGRVLEDVQGRLDIAFEDAGEHQLKNIIRPVAEWVLPSFGQTSIKSGVVTELVKIRSAAILGTCMTGPSGGLCPPTGGS
jgi:class 3 adenylate cyclase